MYRNFGVRPVLENMRRIDVREWVRSGLIHERHFIADWNTGTRKIAGYVCFPRGDRVYLSYYRRERNGLAPVAQRIRLTRTPCNFGGHRHWFRCPRCQRRCALLYLVHDHLICRPCSRVPYYTQQCGDVDRLKHKRGKLDTRLDKRLRRKTRDRLIDEWIEIQEQIDHKIAGSNRSWM